MGNADIVTKQYLRKNDIVADICNFRIYGGKQVILPEQLIEQDSVLLGVPEDEKRGKTVKRERDIFQRCSFMTDGKASYVLVGIENQKEIHYAFPVRTMLYDALNYAEQVNETAKEHKQKRDWKGKKAGEFLSGFYKEDKLIPVVTIVVYFGAEKWDAPTNLKEMMMIPDKEFLPFINDYPMHMIIPEELSEEELNQFHSSLREVLTLIKYSQDKERLDDILHSDSRYSELERDAALVIKQCLNVDLQIEEKEDKVNMCIAWEEMKKDQRMAGRKEGIRAMIETCQELGQTREETISRVITKCSMSDKDAQNAVTQYWKEVS